MRTKYYERCKGDCENCDHTARCEAYQIYRREYDEFPDDEKITNKDIWYAKTDGMYGDYPGSDVDYDQFGYD